MKRFLSVSVALALLTMPALAAEVPTETHTQAASELISIIDIERTMMGEATAMVDAMQQQDAALVPYRDTILKWAQKYLTWEALGPKVAQTHTPELEQMIREHVKALEQQKP